MLPFYWVNIDAAVKKRVSVELFRDTCMVPMEVVYHDLERWVRMEAKVAG